MAQHGIDASAASIDLLDSPTQVLAAQVTEMTAQMTEIMAQMATLQAELQSTKAQNQKLRFRGFGKLLDEDELEYTPSGAAAASAAAPAAPAIPASFLTTPDMRGEKASWAHHGWVDWSDQAAPAIQPPQQRPGFVDPWYEAARTREKSADEATWAAKGWVDRSNTVQTREPWSAPAQWHGG